MPYYSSTVRRRRRTVRRSRRKVYRRPNTLRRRVNANYSISRPLSERGTMVRFSRLLPDQLISEAIADVKDSFDPMRLEYLPDYTEFTNLFQQYRIVKCEAYWRPMTNVRGGLTTQTSTPLVYIAFDPNDTSPPGTIDDLRQLEGCRTYYGYKPFKIVWYPKPITPVYQQGATFAYCTVKTQWIDTDYPAVEHYGIKYALPANNSTAVPPVLQHYTVSIRVTILCRRVK